MTKTNLSNMSIIQLKENSRSICKSIRQFKKLIESYNEKLRIIYDELARINCPYKVGDILLYEFGKSSCIPYTKEYKIKEILKGFYDEDLNSYYLKVVYIKKNGKEGATSNIYYWEIKHCRKIG